MEEIEEFKDDLISDVVKKGARVLPNARFEDQMMLKIHAEAECKRAVAAQLKISLGFFIGALFFGLLLVLAALFGKIFEQYDIKTITVLSLLVIGVFGVLNVDNYRRLITKFS